MKKAGIITHYDVHNHGAVLQLYALVKQLEKMGYNASALTYRKNYDFIDPNIEAKYNISYKSIPIYFRYLKNNGVKRTFYNYQKRHMLNTFKEENSLIGEYYSNAHDLDIVVIGSDEIFSIEAGLNPWFYGIGVDCNRVVSYAASFGPTTMEMINEHHLAEYVKAGLASIRPISVRDANSWQLVCDLCNYEPKIVCDPVLLYGFDEEIANLDDKIEEKYAILYSYDDNLNDNTTIENIKKYCYEKNLKIYSVGYYHGWCDKNINIDPKQLLKVFRDASMVFTDTFHGTVLSILMNTPFMTKVNTNGNKLSYLLKQYDVEFRRTESFADIDIVDQSDIDFNKINSLTERYRKEGITFLKNALGE